MEPRTITEQIINRAKKSLEQDFKPISDVRASAKYRLEVAKNLLHKCFLDYQNQWPFLKTMLKTVDIPAFNIQKYSKGDHFASLHSERTTLNTLHRLFAWMTYLNDVDDGGQTNFDHYGIKIKPEIGKTLIWPAEWTHSHKGNVLTSGLKYIITGWCEYHSYLKKPQSSDKN